MSVLETPRIYFRGHVAWDPITTNNWPKFYDETDAETVYPTTVDKVKAFRESAIAQVTATRNRSWNPHGTHRSKFYDSAVSGADCGAGLMTNDPFVGSPANFMGMLVDLEPFGAFSSQLFFDAITFGIDGGYRILAPRTTRFTDRYINFNRTGIGAIAGVASVVWQTAFPKNGGLRIDAFDSSVLQALQKALEDDDILGLTVQFNSYRTIYYDNRNAYQAAVMAAESAALQVKLQGGGFQPNPARSPMVGVIGLWRKGEPSHEPCDRTLITGPDDSQNAPTVADIHARLTNDTITLDLSNSISEDDLDLTKHDFGTLSVVSVDSGGNAPVTLASFDYSQYDKSAYEATSGILTLKLAAALPADSTLQLRDANNKILLAESALRALPLVPNLYVNQNDPATATFQVYDRGVYAGGGIDVTICVMTSDGGTVLSTFDVTTESDGTFSFPLRTSAPGINAYVPLFGKKPPLPQQGIDPMLYNYMYVRVLPTDAELAALPPTWDNVYGKVLANWHAMAPCMDNWLDLGSEAQVRSFGTLLKKLTNAAAFEHFRYMPVTRDLTPGARKLLYNFLDAPPAHEMLAAAAPEEKPQTDFVELSKKMRSS